MPRLRIFRRERRHRIARRRRNHPRPIHLWKTINRRNRWQNGRNISLGAKALTVLIQHIIRRQDAKRARIVRRTQRDATTKATAMRR